MRLFIKHYTNEKSGSALGVSVNAIVMPKFYLKYLSIFIAP
uniref:Uncharacterized protein n=1 Tax=uncultured Desulfobacterium sp. TaxID=201089 RepID=E1YBX2_9BACT|nr:unknown protein [uncultured Desulfobacterium sp.]